MCLLRIFTIIILNQSIYRDPSALSAGAWLASDQRYKCIPCSSTSFKFKYKVSFTALDGTDEAEMVCFGDIARRMIGKPVQQLLRISTGQNVYPADITKLVSLRFTFAVTMTRQSFYKDKKTYNVAALVTAHGHPAAAPANAAHDAVVAQSGGSSSNSGSQDAPEQPVPITPASALSSPDLSKTPPIDLASLETPVSNKRGRGGRSKGGRTPASRRKLQMLDDDEATGAPVNTPPSSAAHDEVQASDDERSSAERSPGVEST